VADALRHEVLADGTVTDHPVTILATDVRERGDGKRLALAKAIAGITGVATDEIARRAERAARAAMWRRRRAYAAVAVLLGIGGLAWWKQDFLKEQYHWRVTMGASVLSAEEERVKAAKRGSEFKECANGCPTMIVVPAGRFMMGSSLGEIAALEEKFQGVWFRDEDPQHEVMIAKPFAVSKYDVTFTEWDQCTNAATCPEATDNGWGRGDRPVSNVSWDDAKLYVAWLSRESGKRYRLLSESEWEYAARAGTTTAYPWGDEIGKGNANCNGCGSELQGPSAPVGKFNSNDFGLYDLNGQFSSG
jgi:formylglycine-generating enzyme required for sulfatase activity